MNLILGIIVATIAITVMIVIRVIASESVMKERLKASRSDNACDSSSCLQGCGSGHSDPARDSNRRSAPHAS